MNSGLNGGLGVSPNGYANPGHVAHSGPRILNSKNHVLTVEDEFKKTPTGLEVFDTALKGGVVLGKNGVGTSYLVCGEAGTGKSSCMLAILAGLATAEHRAVYLTAEQEDRAVLATAKKFGFTSDYMDIVSIPAGRDGLRVAEQILLQTRAQIAVYDSVQKMKTLAGEITRPLTRFLISRLNKHGEAYGEREQEHDPDVLIWVEYMDEPAPGVPRRIRTGKNRFDPLGEALYLMENEEIVPYVPEKKKRRK